MSLIAPKAFVDLGRVKSDGKVEASHEYLRFFEDVVREVTSRVMTTDLVIDTATRGLVLKDTQSPPHYWRVTVDNTGALVTTDAGTVRP